jgi:hypothetical protein
MSWSLPPAVIDWAQVVSAVLSFVALAVALIALWKSDRDIARERRSVFELTVLRDLLNRLDSSDGFEVASKLVVRSLVELMPPGDLPLFRFAVELDPRLPLGALLTGELDSRGYRNEEPQSRLRIEQALVEEIGEAMRARAGRR